MTKVTKDILFDLDALEVDDFGFPLVTMETIMGVFNEDRMAHPRRAHIFVAPRLMTRIWMKQLGKDADALMIITAGITSGKNLNTNH